MLLDESHPTEYRSHDDGAADGARGYNRDGRPRNNSLEAALEYVQKKYIIGKVQCPGGR